MKKSKLHIGKINPTLGAIRVVTMILVVITILFLALKIGTRKRNVENLTLEYTNSIDIDYQYFDNYIDRGFSKEQCIELLEGDQIKECVARVMSELVTALFNYSESYSYTQDECKTDIAGIIKNFAKENNIELSDKAMSSVVSYTMDISGITTMYSYGTPTAYRQTIFDKNSNNINDSLNTFEVLATLNQPVFIISAFIMLIICMIIMRLVGGNDDMIYEKICNTITYPSFFLIGISLGYVFGASNGNVLSEYVFKMILIAAVACFSVGIIALFAMLWIKKKQQGNNTYTFETWLKKAKKRVKMKKGE